MNTVELTDAEITVLHDVVNNYLTELHTEISYTDDRDFKAALRRRQEALQSAQEKLGQVVKQLA